MMKRTLFNFSPAATEPLPAYRIRRSARALHVNLTIGPTGGLTVVVPRGFDERLIPGLIREQRHWIEAKLAQSGHSIGTDVRWQRPSHITLAAVSERWLLDYHTNPAVAVRICENAAGKLRVTGAVDNNSALRAALRRWLKRRAHRCLPQRLAELATQHEFDYARVTIRHQRSRWGSCSSRGTISLNARLMFVTPELVDHVLLHELSHTVHPNHGAEFQKLLTALLPDHRQQRTTLRQAWITMPDWVHD